MSSNSARGRNSKDLVVDNSVVEFFNRNVSTYPTEVGSAFFAPVDVRDQKDVAINIARANAEQEYNRIMSLVQVLQTQAQELKQRLLITELVHKAKYNFRPVVNNNYWLVDVNGSTILSMLGPNDWSTGCPDNYRYISRVKFLGDYTWTEVTENK